VSSRYSSDMALVYLIISRWMGRRIFTCLCNHSLIEMDQMVVESQKGPSGVTTHKSLVRTGWKAIRQRFPALARMACRHMAYSGNR
jgi:hypothetical protein